MVMPVFADGELVLFVSNIAHHADIGGMAPGSMAGGMTEIYQEGLRIPPIRLFRGGELDRDIMDLILLNVRVPEERRGDYNAQIAANRLAVRRCEQLVAKWSAPVIREGCGRIVEAVEKRIRAAVAALPDGVYRFEDVLDDDGLGTEDIAIRVEIEIAGDRIRFDFDGTAPQVRGNLNVTMAGLQACCLYAMKVLVDPECPQNHGMLAPIEIRAPQEDDRQRRVSGRVGRAGADRTADRGRHPRRARGGAAGPGDRGRQRRQHRGFLLRPRPGRALLRLPRDAGGRRGRAVVRGRHGRRAGPHDQHVEPCPIEALENEYPLMIERYELVEDSGGAGKWRGGLGLRRVYRPLGHVVNFSGQGERCVNAPWGVFGGGPGATGRFELRSDDGEVTRISNKPSSLEVEPDTSIVVTTAGAGGYGPPEERTTEALAEDRRSGKFSPDYLMRAYGKAE